MGRRAVNCFRSLGVEALALSDNNPRLWGRQVDGATVLPPAVASELYGGEALFIVTIWNAVHSFRETNAQLSALGCSHIIPSSPVYWRFPETFLPFFCLSLPRHVFAQRRHVLQAHTIWADEQSRAEYLAHVRWRALGDFAGLPQRSAEESYFPESLFVLSPDEEFVDCGAFDGDTIRSFLGRRRDGFRRVDAIEPDPKTFTKLQHYVDGLPPSIRHKIALHCCGVGAARRTVAFDATGTALSHVSDSGTSMIEELPLDTLCATARPTFIKMDVEGAERNALLAAMVDGAPGNSRSSTATAVCASEAMP